MNKLFVSLVLFIAATCATAQSSGPINTPMLNKAYYFVGISPYTTTIQSAVTAACAAGKGEVIVPPGVTPADSPTAVTGCTAIKLVVQITLPWACYASTGGAYSSTACGTGGSGVASVSIATANGFQGSSSGGSTPVLTLNVDSSHLLPVNNGNSSLFLNQAGGYTTPIMFYQTVAAASTAQTQRSTLSFSTNFTLSDSSSPSQTNVDLVNVGTAATTSNVCSVTTDSKGRVTGVTSSTPHTCNSYGCYSIACDGTVTESGTIALTANGATYYTTTILTPYSTGLTSIVFNQPVVVGTFSTDPTTPPCVALSSQTVSSAAVYMARCIIAGAGGGLFDENFTLDWSAIAHP